MKNARKISNERAKQLRHYALTDDTAKKEILYGTHPLAIKNAAKNKKRIMSVLGATENDWNNPEWQMKNRIRKVETLSAIFPLSKKEYNEISKVSEKFRFGITPYYLSLIDISNPNCPIKAQCVPSIAEMRSAGDLDPMSEEFTNPSGSITRRYPSKLLINVTNGCPSFCRHCQRRRRIGEIDAPTSKAMIDESIAYVRENPEIREVLVSGGDPFTLDNKQLESIFKRLREIKHLDILRVGTRTLVTLPQRINKELALLLRKYKVLLATQINHAVELTKDAIAAIELLVDHGVPVRNQMVLLNKVNNNSFVMQKTNEEILKARGINYYLFHPKKVKGTEHFYVTIDEGLKIMKHLEGHTSGMCKPTYIINAAGGLGKVPLVPQQNLTKGDDGNYTITTWENKKVNIGQ